MIGLVKDEVEGWWKRFSAEMEHRKISYRIIQIAKTDWLDHIYPCEAVIWRPNLAEPLCTQAREKLFFIETILKRRVYPSQACWWHYNSKRAQHFLAKKNKIRMPRTFVTYSYEEAYAFLGRTIFPMVSKGSGGASSKNVRLLTSREQALKELNLIFTKGLWNRIKRRSLKSLCLKSNQFNGQKEYIYYQEFLPGNNNDYRVTTIGPSIAFAFSRRNRKDDFRASGSGNINYDSVHDLDAISYCLQISENLGFDTMCYDILYRDKTPYICEFSFTFNDRAIFNCPGYFEKKNNHLNFIERNVWPQSLIIDHLKTKWSL